MSRPESALRQVLCSFNLFVLHKLERQWRYLAALHALHAATKKHSACINRATLLLPHSNVQGSSNAEKRDQPLSKSEDLH